VICVGLGQFWLTMSVVRLVYFLYDTIIDGTLDLVVLLRFRRHL
jgi:hypothetical protein